LLLAQRRQRRGVLGSYPPGQRSKRGGDVDTVATIALAAASWSVDYAQDLPVALVEGLENGAFGRTYLKDLDRQLVVLDR